MIVLALRVCGGTWEQWEDDLTFDRLQAIIRSTDDCPPIYLSAYSIAIGLGTLKPKESQQGADDFLQFFGAEGQI